MKLLFIVLILLYSQVVGVSAEEYDGIFKILDEQYIENISELPYSAGTPEKIEQSSEHIRGWIDIVGFRDVVHVDGIDYINGNPADKAIIQYDAWGTGVSVDSVTKTITVYLSGNNTVAKMDIILKWHYYYSCNCNKNGCSTCRKDVIEYATFYDYEVSPETYQPLINTFIVDLIQYNNSLYENIGIIIPKPDSIGIMNTTLKYNGSTAIHRFAQANIEKTNKSVYYANLTHVDYWKITGKNISQIVNIIFIDGNLSKNINYIKITGSTLYETVSVNSSQYNISRVEFCPEKEFDNRVLIGFIGIIGIFFISACFLINRFRVNYLTLKL